MALNVRAKTSCSCKSTGRSIRLVVPRAASLKQESHIAVANIALSAAAAAMLLSAPSPVFATDSAGAAATTESAPAAPAQTERTSTVTSISFARVDARVTEKLRQRDENLAWKCKGVNMYDCDGELAEAAEKRFEEMSKIFGSSSK
ncbi:hypothetical protein PLESTB_000496900 [Pleodorina starrii]|uniref:Uncharacterized protein n=1 Tax=Pleodorina starrii TaxID=330485 RepID=A0A9W6F073_9CHLO|nr:hypothetical protein PLESTM_000368300 [Pleodorina starrii]GLC51389.1 hypothetical protein PLESTB_000496900 [Pleodorina starrii]GLC63755.1 hypothetical protein PLESTF_000070500 [Pleodorina starrii]